jgi:hypothetical protein
MTKKKSKKPLPLNKNLMEIRQSLLQELFDSQKIDEAKEEIVEFEDGVTGTKKEAVMTSIMMRPYIESGIEFGKKFFQKNMYYSFEKYGTDVSKYLDNCIKILLDKGVPAKTVNFSIASVLKDLSNLAIETNIKVGSTINLYELIQVTKKSKEFRGILNTSFSKEKDFKAIEESIDEKITRAMAILTENSAVYRRIADTISLNQFKQIIVNIGPKSDLYGMIVPTIPDTNYVRGLRDVNDFYIMAQTSRKVLITSHKTVRQSGYLTRKLSLLAIDMVLSKSGCKRCNTKHPVPFKIETKESLRRLNNRYYTTSLKDKDLKVIDLEKDSDLIGKTIYLRSPITCNSKDGICHTCYGKLSLVNNDIHAGAVAVLFLTALLTQRLNNPLTF